jgi:microcin C transport system permease protein
MAGLNAVNERRWRLFKANRRGWYSLWIFSFLFVLSLCAELIANDKPLLLSFQGQLYYPLLEAYPETTFGGIFPTETNYRDPFVAELIDEAGGWMIWPPIRYSYETVNLNTPSPAPSPPTGDNLLGTDDQARDVAARLLYGFRISVLFGLILTLFSTVVGVIAGAVQGYFGGWIDLLGQRFIEIWTSVPSSI